MSRNSKASLLVALLCAATAHAGVNEFTLTGNDGGYIYSIAAQPGNSNLVLAGSSRGIHRSTNGGATWTLATPTMIGYPTHIFFDPLTPSRVFVLNRQFFVSEDAGQSFAATTEVSDTLDYLAVSGNRIYVGTPGGTIYRSDNDGLAWTQLTVPWASSTAQMNTIAADPSNDGVLYACIQGVGTYKTTNGGATWSNPPSGLSPCTTIYNWSRSIAVSPTDANRIVASTADGIFLSTNGGASWSVTEALNYPRSVIFDPHTPDYVLGFDYPGRLLYSTDGGATWPLSQRGASLKVRDVEGMAFGDAAGQLYIATPNGPMYSADNGATFTLRVGGIHATDVREVIAADDGTIYALQFSGQAGLFRRSAGPWVPLDNAELQGLLLNPLEIADIATSAENASLLYAADQAGGLYRSDNGGADWIAPPPSAQLQLFDIAVDPTNPLKAYAAKAVGGMMRTINGGLTFTECGPPSSLPLRNVIVDRASPNILYAIGRYGQVNGIYKSSDSCASWTDITTQLPYYFNSITIDPVDHQKIYLAHYGGVQRSRNGGATWETLHFGFNDEYPDYVLGMRVLLDPVLPSTIWVLNNDTAGFARSVDDGATWQKVAYPYAGNPGYFFSGVLDPLRPDTLVAGAIGYGLVEYQVAPDLQVTLDAPAGPLPTDASVVATVNLRNLGPLDASAADVTITLPANLSVAAPPAGCTSSLGTLRCRVAPVRVNQTIAIPLTLVVAATPGSGNLTVSVAGHEADPVSSNNTVTRNLASTLQNDFELGIATPSTTVDHGDLLRLVLTGRNHGPSPATSTQIVLPLGNFTLSSVSAGSGGVCASSAGTVTCSYARIEAGAVVTMSVDAIAATVGSNALEATMSGVADSTSAAISITTRPVADFSVQVSGPADPVAVLANYQYTITVRNDGPDAAQVGAVATFGLATTTGATANGLTCTRLAASIECTAPSLAANASATVVVDMSGPAPGAAGVSVNVTTSAADRVATNNSASTTTTVRLVGDAGVTLTASAAAVTTNTAFRHTATVRNLGPNESLIRLTVPVTGATITSVSGPAVGCTNTAQSASCDLRLGSGAAAEVFINLNAATAGTVTATATVVYEGTDPQSANNSASASTTVSAPPPPPGSSSGGGGGGGSLDWLALALLAGALARRGVGRSRGIGPPRH